MKEKEREDLLVDYYIGNHYYSITSFYYKGTVLYSYLSSSLVGEDFLVFIFSFIVTELVTVEGVENEILGHGNTLEKISKIQYPALFHIKDNINV